MSPGPTPGATLTRRLAAVAGVLLATLTLGAPAHAATAPPATITAGSPVAFSRPQPDRIAVEAPTVAAAPTYRVVPGDTLGAIAGRFCGTFSAYARLAAASGIGNPDLIYPGQVIRLTGCHSAPSTPGPKPATPRPSSPAPAAAPVLAASSSSAADRVVAFALAQVGKRYQWAAAGPNAYDCSGLVVAAYARIGIRLPHQDQDLMRYGRPVSRAELQPGDVIQPFIGHVVIYIGNGRVVEAANSRLGVITNTLYAFRQARRYA